MTTGVQGSKWGWLKPAGAVAIGIGIIIGTTLFLNNGQFPNFAPKGTQKANAQKPQNKGGNPQNPPPNSGGGKGQGGKTPLPSAEELNKLSSKDLAKKVPGEEIHFSMGQLWSHIRSIANNLDDAEKDSDEKRPSWEVKIINFHGRKYWTIKIDADLVKKTNEAAYEKWVESVQGALRIQCIPKDGKVLRVNSMTYYAPVATGIMEFGHFKYDLLLPETEKKKEKIAKNVGSRLEANGYMRRANGCAHWLKSWSAAGNARLEFLGKDIVSLGNTELDLDMQFMQLGISPFTPPPPNSPSHRDWKVEEKAP